MSDLIKELFAVAERYGYQMGGGGSEEKGFIFRVYPKRVEEDVDRDNTRELSKGSTRGDTASIG